MGFGECLQKELERSTRWCRDRVRSGGCLVQAVLVYALLSPLLCVCCMPIAVILWESRATPTPTPVVGWEPIERGSRVSPYPTYTSYPTYTPLPSPTASPSPSPTPIPSMGSRWSPVSLEETYVWRGDGRLVELTVDDAIFGEEAIRMVMEANQFNDPPQEGYGFAVIHVRARYIAGDESEAWGVDEFDFVVVSDNVVLRPPAIVDPKPQFEWKGFPGASVEGWMTFRVSADDPSPILVFAPTPGSDVSEGVWFALK